MALDRIRTIISSQRHLLFQFIKRDLKGRFAGHIGGPIWLLINPLSQICIYFFLFSMVLKIRLSQADVGTESFIAFFLTGLFPWLALNEAISRSSVVLLENAGLITKVVFPSGLLPLSVVISSFILNGAGFILFLLYMAFKVKLTWWWLFIPIHLFLLMAFSLGFSALIASITVFLRDIQQLINILLTVWFYTTPIIYPLSMVPERFKFIIKWCNPIYPHLELIREAIFKGHQDLTLIIMSTVWSFVMLFIGVWVFRRLKPAFSDVL